MKLKALIAIAEGGGGEKQMRGRHMLEWIYYRRPPDPPANCVSWEAPEDTPFTKATRDMLVRRAPAS